MNWVGGEGANLIFRQTSPSDSLIYLSIYHIPVKTWLRVYLVIISALKLKVNKQKNPFVIQYQKLDFFQNSSVPFHRATFGYSISCVVLRDKPNESCQNSKKFGRNAISTTKKVLFLFFKKKMENSITQAKANAPISRTSSERLKLTKEKFTLHEVYFGAAAKISTIFYQ